MYTCLLTHSVVLRCATNLISELNPRLGGFDLKEFCELRPGLIGWCVINIGGRNTSAFLVLFLLASHRSLNLSLCYMICLCMHMCMHMCMVFRYGC